MMQFTGQNLELVSEAIAELEIQLRNMVVTCPDSDLYADALAEYEEKLKKVRQLQARIAKADHLGH